MTYCKRCNADVIFGKLENAAAEERIRKDSRRKGRKSIFAGIARENECPECGDKI